jgi:hypothetical protein
MAMKFGMKLSAPDPRHLRFARYLTPGLPPPPPAADYSTRVSDWTMMGNDAAGDCVLAMCGHATMAWTSNSAGLYTPPASDIIGAYSTITGYVPGNDATDNGTDPTTALKYWRDTGISGHKIGAWAMLDLSPLHFQLAVSLFECAAVSVNLPENFSFDWTQWVDTSADPDPSMGHEVLMVAYNADGAFIVSWGKIYFVSWAFLAKFCVESEVMFSTDIVAGGNTPTGVDGDLLMTDLVLVGRTAP